MVALTLKMGKSKFHVTICVENREKLAPRGFLRGGVGKLYCHLKIDFMFEKVLKSALKLGPVYTVLTGLFTFFAPFRPTIETVQQTQLALKQKVSVNNLRFREFSPTQCLPASVAI